MLAVPHSLFNDLVNQFSVVARRTKQWVGGGAGTAGSRRRWSPVLMKCPPCFGKGVVNGREMPVMNGGLDRAFDIRW
jgi:hypothetical protein